VDPLVPHAGFLERWFGRRPSDESSFLWPRWLFLRGLGAIFFSAFYSLVFQIHGLIGPRGILPAEDYLALLARAAPRARYWIAPTLLWISASDAALTTLVVVGLVASVALILNLWPRAALLVALIAFLSFIGAAQDFASYQSDGMLLEAGFLALFFCPPGLRPRLGARHPPSAASLWLLRWEWFRIYFESGVVKLASGDPQWRGLTAMDHYYENGPLPTWIGWWAHQMPHGVHAATALSVLVFELGVVWMLFLPRRFRIALFILVTPLQIGIIATANYAFLNYLVLLLGILVVDDRFLGALGCRPPAPCAVVGNRRWRTVAFACTAAWVFYTTVVEFPGWTPPTFLFPPANVLEPFRIANRYGLFATMTSARYEIEFQGTLDGRTWVAYPFRYKPQAVDKAPGIYAPYQPRFEWNLWFASLTSFQNDPWVMTVEERLRDSEPAVLALFSYDPFQGRHPQEVRAVLWQYWFTDRLERKRTGAWWRREELGLYAPAADERTISDPAR
jgi:hypothetical protein